MKKEELLESLSAVGDIGPLRNGLDDGCLVLSQTTLYFIAQRMGKWSVLQEWPRTSISNVQAKDGFLGKELTLQSNGRTVTFKKIPADVDASSFVQGHGFFANQPVNTTPEKEIEKKVEAIPTEQPSIESIVEAAVEIDTFEPQGKSVSVELPEETAPKFKTLKDRMAERRQNRASRELEVQETELLKDLGLNLEEQSPQSLSNQQKTTVRQSSQRRGLPPEVPEVNPADRMGKLFSYIIFFMVCSGFLGDC